MSELADELDSGSSGHFAREGSSPFFRIKASEFSLRFFCAVLAVEYANDYNIFKNTGYGGSIYGKIYHGTGCGDNQ